MGKCLLWVSVEDNVLNSSVPSGDQLSAIRIAIHVQSQIKS